MWIGIYGKSNYGTIEYKWASGEPILYTNWEHGSPSSTLKCVFPFYMTVLGKKTEFNDCTNKGWPGKVLDAVANNNLWCSADSDFDENNRFIPCDDGAFYQGCGMMSKESGQWTTDYGDKVSIRPEDETEARGCYSSEYFVCDMMKDGIDRPMPTQPPILGEDCLGIGWTGYTNEFNQPSSKCYKIFSWHNDPTDHGGDNGKNSIGVDFAEALEFCRAQNSDLVSLHSIDDERNVFDLITKYEDSKKGYRDWYWLGFNDRGDGGYVWSDGSGDDYTNWAAGQPEKTAKFEDCSIIINGNGDPIETGWYSNYCNIQAGVVCAIQRGAIPNDNHSPPAPPDLDYECGQADPTLDWYALEHKLDDGTTAKKCFAFVEDGPLMESSAEYACNDHNNGNLISIHHKDDMYTILRASRKNRDANYWIGYIYDWYDYGYKWTDGSPLNYDNFAMDNPGDDVYYNDATYFHATDGSWKTSDSFDERFYVCQMWPNGMGPPIPEEEAHSGGCPDTWLPYKNKCFYFVGVEFVEDRKSWADAEEYCQLTDNGHLASIYDQDYDSFVYAQMVNSNEELWFGLSADQNREWHYTDNTTAYYTPWANGEPNNANGNEYCGAVSRWHGKWNDANCEDVKPFVCSMWKDPTLDGRPENRYNCPAGYSALGSACYKVVQGALSHDAAEAACGQENSGGFTSASLASIWDIHDNMMLKSIMAEQNLGPEFKAWIGLYFDKAIDPTDDPSTIKWRWTDKHPVTYTNWGADEPHTISGDKGCVTINGKGAWFVADSCATTSSYICKLEATWRPENQDNPGEDKCDAEWTGHDGFCYIKRTDIWDSAKGVNDKCHELGAEVVSIHSDSERRFVTDLAKGTVWIGLHRNDQGGFEWSDETGLDYQAWKPGEPNNGGGWTEENCAIADETGFWNDVACSDWNYGVCKKPATHEFCEIPGNQRQECGFPGIDSGTCVGYGCCWVPLDGHYWCFHPKSTAACDSAGEIGWNNKCVPTNQVDARTCSRGADSSLCSNTGTGGGDQTCCMSCQTADCKNEENQWAQGDTNCIARGGNCQYSSLKCSGGGKSYHIEPGFECGGPSERQCCAPAILPPTQPPTSPTIPTVPSQAPPVTPDNGGDGGKTAGIVIGVLFAIFAVMGFGYYVNQNGIPLIAQQQSFGNLNNTNNNDGVTDGISNPLDNASDDGGDVEPVSMVPEPEPTVEPVLDQAGNDGLVTVDITTDSTPETSAPSAFDDFLATSTPASENNNSLF